MQGCDYRPDVQRWARYYAQGGRAFVASWKRALPFLLLVADEIDRRDLPGEFALLPFLESGYQPLPSHGDRPAGMWQLVPDTAREAGLAVTAEYDGRLDALASTGAALDLLARYYKEFADWRLADMAFNSGEFRVKKLVGERDARDLSADELARLAFNRITHEHLDRLLALACIVDDPQRFGVTLPEPGDGDRLDVVALEAGMDLRLAARFSGLDIDEVRGWNAGYRRNRMPVAVTHRLLLPVTHVGRFRASADAVPLALWSDWREQRAARTSGIGSWAAQHGIPVAVLAAANAIDEDATVAPSTQLLLPGREPEPLQTTKEPQRRARRHVVVAGDTLSRVAQHYSIPLERLHQLNPRATSTLHLGDQLLLGDD
jgi:membrane-bound lytic murein transglycosylase D